jgi:hypothetical protein
MEKITQEIQMHKENRKKISHHIAVKDLPAEQQFKALRFEGKNLIDTTKNDCMPG